jgi:hypothetical protein
MGYVSRHSGAPFANGEVLDGTADLEVDINAIVTEINGNLDNSNLAAGAALDGSKLADASIPGAKLVDSTVTIAKMAAEAVPKHHVAAVASYGSLETSNATLVDWTGLTEASLTPGSTSDMIMMDITFSYDAGADDASNAIVVGWSVDGAETDSVMASQPDGDAGNVVVHSSFAVLAPSSGSAIVIKPMQRYNGTGTQTVGYVLFRCSILPGK